MKYTEYIPLKITNSYNFLKVEVNFEKKGINHLEEQNLFNGYYLKIVPIIKNEEYEVSSINNETRIMLCIAKEENVDVMAKSIKDSKLIKMDLLKKVLEEFKLELKDDNYFSDYSEINL